MSKAIKQIADEIGLSKAAVRKNRKPWFAIKFAVGFQ